MQTGTIPSEPGSLSDSELARTIAACARGRVDASCLARDAEAELCRRYVRRLITFGRRRLGSLDEARDLAQSSLLLGLQKLRAGEVREPDKIGSFLFGVARSLSGTEVRKRARSETFDPAERELVAEAFELPDPLARDRVGGCLEKLPERQRTVLLMSFYAERTSDEIADSLGLSGGNVRVLRHRGVVRLRDCLDVELGLSTEMNP